MGAEISPSPEFDSRTIQPAACRYTAELTRPPIQNRKEDKFFTDSASSQNLILFKEFLLFHLDYYIQSAQIVFNDRTDK
jgi:hypothetical protein